MSDSVADLKLYLVTKQDTVLQATGYLVRAKDEAGAKDSVAKGMYIEETATVTLDLLDTETKDVTEIAAYAEGQYHNNEG